MSLILKQSTAKAVSFGPFVDKTDGVTLETGLVSALDHASTGILLSKNGGALTIRHATVTASSYDAYGNYIVTLDTTDTNTCGTLRMQFSEAATCLPVWQDFIVVEEAVFDALFAASAAGYQVPIWAAAGSTVNLSATTIKTATDVETDTADIQSRLPAALTANGNIKSSMVEILTTALTETAGLLAGGFKKFFNVATPTGTINSLPDAVAGAAGGLFIAGTNAATTVTTALTTTFTGNLTGSVASVTGAVGSVTGAVGSVTGLTASDVGAIKTKTDSLTFTKAGEVDANIQSINGTTVLGDGGTTPWGP